MTKPFDGREPMNIHALLAAALLAATPAWAIHKCKAPDGKTVFQDIPCTGQGEKLEVRPASGSAHPAQAAAAPEATKEGVFGESWQRRTYLENRGIPDARSALQAQLKQCDAKQAELAAKKWRAMNNLAGATWEQSISTEMQAAATMCDARTRELRTQLEEYEKELRELKAKK